MDVFKKCTCCGKEIRDLGVNITLEAEAFRYTDLEEEKDIGNTRVKNQETLCYDCFNKFSDLLSGFKGTSDV